MKQANPDKNFVEAAVAQRAKMPLRNCRSIDDLKLFRQDRISALESTGAERDKRGIEVADDVRVNTFSAIQSSAALCRGIEKEQLTKQSVSLKKAKHALGIHQALLGFCRASLQVTSGYLHQNSHNT